MCERDIVKIKDKPISDSNKGWKLSFTTPTSSIVAFFKKFLVPTQIKTHKRISYIQQNPIYIIAQKGKTFKHTGVKFDGIESERLGVKKVDECN